MDEPATHEDVVDQLAASSEAAAEAARLRDRSWQNAKRSADDDE
jgi:hypothetical protein